MCRRNLLLGVFAAGFGLGLIAACFFESTVFCGCVGVACIAAGILLLQKK